MTDYNGKVWHRMTYVSCKSRFSCGIKEVSRVVNAEVILTRKEVCDVVKGILDRLRPQAPASLAPALSVCKLRVRVCLRCAFDRKQTKSRVVRNRPKGFCSRVKVRKMCGRTRGLNSCSTAWVWRKIKWSTKIQLLKAFNRKKLLQKKDN